MTQVKDYVRSLERSRAALRHRSRLKVFTMAGTEWDLLDAVFAPPYSASTGAAMKLLGLLGEDTPAWSGSFLEVGCGTGIIAVSAALAGCERVTALDISEQAVKNAEMNAARHQVTDRLRAVHSDLFDALDPGDRHDTVYWHSNYVLAPEEYRPETVHERAYVDPGYAAHRRFLAQAEEFTTEGGRVLLHFSDRGNATRLRALAAECGRRLRVLGACRVREGEETVEHKLLEIVPVAPSVSVAPRTPARRSAKARARPAPAGPRKSRASENVHVMETMASSELEKAPCELC